MNPAASLKGVVILRNSKDRGHDEDEADVEVEVED